MAYDERVAATQAEDPVGIFHWDARTPMFLVGTGLGDGRYAVREIRSGSDRVGVEVDFLPADPDE